MVPRSAGPTDVQAPTARRQRGRERAESAHAVPLARSALEFAVRCHHGQWRESDGAPFIEHPLEVARLLRDAGCSDVLVCAGLLHEVMQQTEISATELQARFGPDVANLVQAVTDTASVASYRQRKLVLREQVWSGGADAAILFAAHKIAKVRELPDQIQRDGARIRPTAPGSRTRNRLEHYHQMRLEHYFESLRMLQRVAPRHPLVARLATELDTCPL